MRPCTRVGLDITWRCNWRCRHCFYLRDPRFHHGPTPPLDEILAKIDQAKAGGLDHAVMVGYGEPALAKDLRRILAYCHDQGMATSMITNGAVGLQRYQQLYAEGLDHLHISSHGLDGTLDEIVDSPGAFRRQAELKEWLASEALPFRTNVTLQQRNYRELPDLAEFEIERSVFHFVFLGFLPHYEWAGHLHEVAVSPAALRPYIEAGARSLLDAGTLFTIRYHPMCHLSPDLWPYVVNARYVFFDPWEWNYELQVTDVEALWKASVAMGNGTACKAPCSSCLAYRHCGGWNGRYAEAFDGAGLSPILEIPDRYVEVWDRDGGLHDLNPANALSGTIQRVES